MQAIVSTIWRGLTWLFDGLTGTLGAMWQGIASAFVWVAEWLASFVGSLVAAVLEIAFNFAELAIGLLPDMPEMDEIGDVSFLSQANQYLPVSEALALLGVWSAVFSAIAIYKLIKLVSPVSA